MNAEIQIEQTELTALVDAEDWPLLARRRWYMGGHGYLCTPVSGAGMVNMHSLVMPTKCGCMVDHINRNRLDNRKINLRLVTARHNIQNAPKRSHSRQPYKGVRQAGSRWSARVRFEGKEQHLGVFDTAEQAAAAYNSAALKLFGELAYVNEVAS